MHDLLTKLLQANLAAAAAIALVLILRKAIRAGFGARIAYTLWLLVPLAAAASLAPPRPAAVAIPQVAPPPLVQAAEDTAAQVWSWSVDVAPAGLDPMRLVVALWIAGLMLMVAWLAWRQAQFLLLLRYGEAGPAVIGFLRPRIITPSDFEERFDLREQTLVLAHEKIHLVRHDARINALVALTRCVCWFNPLVHIAAHLMRVDQELACDAAVVARHPKARAPYAQALLKAQLAARPLPLGCYWPAGTEHPLTERIAMLKQSNPSMVRRLAGAAVITALAAGAGYAAWAAAPATAPAAAAPLTYVEQSLTPQPEYITAQPVAVPATPARALRQPIPSGAEERVGTQLAQAEPLVPAQQQPTPIAKVYYVGPARLPAAQPFVKYFDADAPVLIHGRVAEIRLGDGLASDAMIQGDDGKLYRVIGGSSTNLSAEQLAQVTAMVGQTVTVRGYLAHDKTCDGGCLVNGRVTYLDGSAVMSPSAAPAP